ncbi:MAG: hypothetical protein UY87_C0088G0004 [Candidatus Peribacteria bacterium GW2011_GWC2_54_8]|nr:MAG: hypothetical protein UY87_C0088G0004 [Candidatus Peribacteria bacterium GW2011_GWC2_54_8]
MNLLMVTGDRSILEGRRGAFWHTLQGLRAYWERIDILCPRPRVAAGANGAAFLRGRISVLLCKPAWHSHTALLDSGERERTP